MRFPSAPQFRYKKNTLSQVICQLRFPAILRIDAEIPSGFQESIRRDFPSFAQTSVFKVPIPSVAENVVITDRPQPSIELPEVKNYEFSTLDSKWKVNLGRTFIALSTNDYTTWSDFRVRTHLPLSALIGSYSPTRFNRIGLRYINVVNRVDLGISTYPWSSLISSTLMGMLSCSDTSDAVDDLECAQELSLDGGCKARIATKLLSPQEAKETRFVLDMDFYSASPTAIEEAEKRLDELNMDAYDFFHWATTEHMRKAMGAETG